MKTLKDKLAFLANFHTVPATMFLNEDSKKQFECSLTALNIFIEYAFEKSVSVLAFKDMAKTVLEKANIDFVHINKLTDEDIKYIWNEYEKQKEMNNIKGLNKKNNPFYYVNNKSILEILRDNGIENLANWCCEKIVNNKIKTAYDTLNNIRGVGAKIASLYLRDIAYLKEINHSSDYYFYMLQPIDTWIVRTYKIIFDDTINTEKAVQNDKLREIVQMEITKNCLENSVSPIDFNKGAWYFGSRIAKTYDRLKDSLENTDVAKKHIHEALTILEKEKSILSKILE